MKRDEILAIFPEATKAQIDSILNQAGAELTALQTRLTEATTKRTEAEEKLAALIEESVGLKTKNKELEEKVEAGMNAEELLAKREADAAQRELEFAIKNNTLDARSIFQSAGLPLDDADIQALISQVVSEDADKTRALATQIAALTEAQRKSAADAKQEELLKGNPGLGGASGADGAAMTKDTFMKMSFVEQQKMLEENPNILSSLA